MNKFVHPGSEGFQVNGEGGQVLAAYIPNCKIDDQELFNFLNTVIFARVKYVSQYHKANRTPRLTQTWAHSDGNIVNPNYNSDSPNIYDHLRVIPNPHLKNPSPIVSYRGLNFRADAMPPVLEKLSQFCRLTAILNYGFDPCYNSVIIGKYVDGSDEIGFHFDPEDFLEHTFCANVTLGFDRDFQFKIEPQHLLPNKDGVRPEKSQTHELKLSHKSLFFFSGLEHALPKRVGHKPEDGVRYSISFRNMRNDVGVGNSMYYCRGVDGAIDDTNKQIYIQKLHKMQIERYGSLEAARLA